MSNLPWKHIVTVLVSFIVAYGMSEIAAGFNYVFLHWNWQAVIQGLIASGLYTGGLVQNPPSKS